MDNVIISPITINDTKEISYISESLGKLFLSTWDSVHFENEFSNDTSHFFIAKDLYNNILGFICTKILFDELHILNICVNINYMRKGIGYLLLSHIINYAKEHNIQEILLEVNVNNTPAIELYNKAGFKILSTRKNYYFNKSTNTNDDAYVMNLKEE